MREEFQDSLVGFSASRSIMHSLYRSQQIWTFQLLGTALVLGPSQDDRRADTVSHAPACLVLIFRASKFRP